MCGRFIPKMGQRHDSRQLFLNFFCIGFHYSYMSFSQHSFSHSLYGCVMYIMYMTHIDLPYSAGRSTPNFSRDSIATPMDTGRSWFPHLESVDHRRIWDLVDAWTEPKRILYIKSLQKILILLVHIFSNVLHVHIYSDHIFIWYYMHSYENIWVIVLACKLKGLNSICYIYIYVWISYVSSLARPVKHPT